MPETRYAEVYEDSVLVDTEAYEVSDDQLADEGREVGYEEATASLPSSVFGTVSIPGAHTWIDTNVVDLASAKVALKHLVEFCILLRERVRYLAKD